MVERFRSRPLVSSAQQARASMKYRSGPILWPGNRSLQLNQDVAERACRTINSPILKRLSLYPVIALIVLILFT